MGYDSETDIGGMQKRFLTTHWTLIDGIKAKDWQESALIDLLIRRYWKPAYCYLRRTGYDNEQAKDLTQGFFQDVVLARKLVQRADPSRGRFRSFLLNALKQYALNEKTKEMSQMRSPKNNLTSLEAMGPIEMPPTVLNMEPEVSYNYAWVSALLDEVLTAVEQSCREDGMETHWQLFNNRIVEPILSGVEPPSLGQLSAKLGVSGPDRASNMIITVKRRFREALRRCMRRSVIKDELAEDEFDEILSFFPD